MLVFKCSQHFCIVQCMASFELLIFFFTSVLMDGQASLSITVLVINSYVFGCRDGFFFQVQPPGSPAVQSRDCWF